MRWLIGLILAAWAAGSAFAADTSLEFDYKRFSGITERLAGASKLDRLIVRIRANVPGKQIEPGKLVFTVLAAAGPREIRPDAEGFLSIPNDPALNKENPKVRVNVDKTVDVKFSVVIRCRVSAGTVIPYSELGSCVEQMNAGIAEQAGMMSFLAPSAKGVFIRCGTGCVASLPGGNPSEIRADKNGTLEILHDVYRKIANLSVTLSAPPTAVIPIIR